MWDGLLTQMKWDFTLFIISVFAAYIRNPEENCRIYLTECCKCWLDVSNGHEIQASRSGRSGNIKWLEVGI